MISKVLAGVMAAVAMLTGLASSAAEIYPTKPVTVVINTGAGGTQSALMTVLRPGLEKKWNQPIIMMNRPGAGSYIGTREVARAAPDGYTLLFSYDSITTHKFLMKGNSFDPSVDLAPISLLIRGDYVIYITTAMPAKTLPEFVQYAKSRPGKVNFAATGRAGQFVEVNRFSQIVGIEMQHIPFQSAPDVQSALTRNDVQFVLTSITTGKPLVDAGVLRAVATTGEKRLAEFPDTPTTKELGINYIAPYWYGFFAPLGTPKDIVDKVSADLREAAMEPEARKAFQKFGVDVIGNTPAEFGQFLKNQVKVQSETVQKAGIQPE